MKKIVLLTCTKLKKAYRCTAVEMYSESEHFRVAYEYAKMIGDEIYILSPRYGLLQCDEVIEPYDEHLANWEVEKQKLWAKHIITQLKSRVNLEDYCFEIIAGKSYYQYLTPYFKHYEVPLAGKRIGEWIPKLKELIRLQNEKKSIVWAERIHKVLRTYPRYDYLQIDQIPFENGIYILFDKREQIYDGDRIVRVGTHRGENRLKGRLKQHFLHEDKNASQLRILIGEALLRRLEDTYAKVWGQNTRSEPIYKKYQGVLQTNKERDIEREVSRYIRENMYCVCIESNIYEDRLKLKSGLISSLKLDSSYQPSSHWLGNYSEGYTVKTLRMWNKQKGIAIPLDEKMWKQFVFKENSNSNEGIVQSCNDEIAKYILHQIGFAKKQKRIYVDIMSGDIHNELGLVNRMPSVCRAMYKLKTDTDEILHTTPSGYSSTIKIRYYVR